MITFKFGKSDKAGVCDDCCKFRNHLYRFFRNPSKMIFICAGCIRNAFKPENQENKEVPA